MAALSGASQLATHQPHGRLIWSDEPRIETDGLRVLNQPRTAKNIDVPNLPTFAWFFARSMSAPLSAYA